jgi:hypothetical protein
VQPTSRISTMVVSSKWAAFIQSGVSIVIGSRDLENMPCVTRGLGCRIAADGSRVTILVAKSQSRPVLDAMRASRAICVVFSLPSTHTTIQLKGKDAAPSRVLAGDPLIVDRHSDAFAADAATLGYSKLGIRTLLWCDPADLVAITFTPQSAFLQTPGPQAGEPLED